VSEPLLTETELAGFLKVSKRSIRHARQAGALRYLLVGRAVRYRIADVDAFIETSIIINDNQYSKGTLRSQLVRRPNGKAGFLEKNGY